MFDSKKYQDCQEDYIFSAKKVKFDAINFCLL